MKLFTYIQYFFYLGINWNWRIAYLLLQQEIQGEKKYGIETTGADELQKLAASGTDISHATVYMPASYGLLEEVLPRLPEINRNHFIDFGCGKGRAICVAAHYGFKKVSGVDFSDAFCKQAFGNIMRTRERLPDVTYGVFHQDALDFEIPTDADCLFFFNPFDRFVMAGVCARITASYQQHPRDIYVIYFNPLFKDEFLNIGFKQIFHTLRMTYMEAVIMLKTPVAESKTFGKATVMPPFV